MRFNLKSITGVFLCATALAFGVIAPIAAADDGEAYLGQPFGVARVAITVTARTPDSGELGDLFDQNETPVPYLGRRVLYPVAITEEVIPRKGTDQLADVELGVYFLFRGNQPLKLTLGKKTVELKPATKKNSHKRLLKVRLSSANCLVASMDVTSSIPACESSIRGTRTKTRR